MIPYNRTPSYYENENRVGPHTPCLICGRAIKNQYAAKWVHVGMGGGYIVTDAEAATNPAADLGFHPIGSDCWRKHPEFHVYENGGVATPSAS